MSRSFDIAEASKYPGPGLSVPAKATFSPDGRYAAWVRSPDRSRERKLYLHQVGGQTTVVDEPGKGLDESTLTHDERLRRERARDLSTGVTTYEWIGKEAAMVVPLGGEQWRFDAATREWSRPWDVPREAIDPRVDPKGERIAWVAGGELFVDGVRVSPPAGLALSHGLADYLAQEEFGRAHGYWWSPDARFIAFTTVDESMVPEFDIAHLADSDPRARETHRFPFPGADNPVTTLHIVEVDGLGTVDCDISDFEYLPRVQWASGGRLVAQALDRHQQRLDVLAFDAGSGERTNLWHEQSSAWVDVHDCLKPLDDGRFIWASERDGFRHLELRGGDGELERALTEGDWMVSRLVGVDQEAGEIYFTASKDGALERRLYRAGLDGGSVTQTSRGAGVHVVSVDTNGRMFLDLHGNIDAPPTLTLHSLADGGEKAVLFSETDERIEQFGLRPPQLTTISTTDGTPLHVAMYLPDGPGPFPALLNPYGGPGEGAQRVMNWWGMTADLDAQWLARNGVAVIVADNRGMWGRGRGFYEAIHKAMGTVEVEDQADVVAELAARGIVDPNRVAISGWSYGGYLALMCLSRRPDVFCAAVAGAPVTDWRRYDSAYTERYMGLPQETHAAYDDSSVLSHAHRITGRLLLIAGLIDENVHFRHSAALLDALAASDIDYELVAYPAERHLPRAESTRVNLDKRIARFVLDALDVKEEQ